MDLITAISQLSSLGAGLILLRLAFDTLVPVLVFLVIRSWILRNRTVKFTWSEIIQYAVFSSLYAVGFRALFPSDSVLRMMLLGHGTSTFDFWIFLAAIFLLPALLSVVVTAFERRLTGLPFDDALSYKLKTRGKRARYLQVVFLDGSSLMGFLGVDSFYNEKSKSIYLSQIYQQTTGESSSALRLVPLGDGCVVYLEHVRSVEFLFTEGHPNDRQTKAESGAKAGPTKAA